MRDPQPGQIEILNDAGDLGRTGLVDQEAPPLILSVNHFFDEGVIAFRTGPGTTLDCESVA